MSALPTYEVRVSTRAKRALLKVLPPGRVEVVVPQRFDLKRVPGFVADHQAWLKHHLGRMQANYGVEVVLPELIELPAIDESWQLMHMKAAKTELKLISPGCLQLSCEDVDQGCALLQRWLQRRARDTLPAWLGVVSEEFALPFNRVTIRGQRTRWGSCSSQKNINLNRAMLLLEPETVRYLMIHELCHTVHLNHSPQFWALVGRCMPEYAAIDRRLRRAMDGLPRWVWC